MHIEQPFGKDDDDLPILAYNLALEASPALPWPSLAFSDLLCPSRRYNLALEADLLAMLDSSLDDDEDEIDLRMN